MALEAQFLSQPLILGVSGLDLHSALDQIPPTKLSRMTNVVRNQQGELTARPGLTSFATFGGGAAVHHTIARIRDQFTGVTRIVVGVGISVAQGASGALLLVESGFSGSPLHLVPYRPPVSGDSFMFIGDSVKMRKASSSIVVPIGLPPATGFASLPGNVGQYVTIIETFAVAAWTNNAGTGAGAPAHALDVVNFVPPSISSIQFTTNAPATPYYQYWNRAIARDLSLVGTSIPGTPVAASDDDYIQISIRLDRPDLINEVRVYLVCSTPFSTTVLPGASATANTDAYMKAFRPSDFTPVYEATATAQSTSSTVNTNEQTNQQLSLTPDLRAAFASVIEQTEPARGQSLEAAPGRAQWTTWGTYGRPLRRGDFRRIGSDTTRGWANITGIVVMVSAASGAPTNVNVWVDDMTLRGGFGPDTGAVGMTAYDYRVTHYDPRTGAEGNPSPILPEANRVNPQRQEVVMQPTPYGDANIVQRLYRRGGALQNNWYFLGANASDGAFFTDSLSDLSVIAGATLETNNDQPVTTVDSAGVTVLAAPLPAIWGPVQDLLFGCGDNYRPGYLYWSKTGKPDSWPAANSLEVSAPSEPLLTGCVWGGQSFTFTRQRMFALYPNLNGAGTVASTPTGCAHGPISPWAVAVGAGAVYFVGDDGVYATSGGPETNISDDDVSGLFQGETRNGYAPIDFTVGASGYVETIRLLIHDNELWLFYRDTNLTQRVLIYSTLYSFWRAYSFTPGIVSGYSDHQFAGSTLYLGGGAGATYTHSGVSDAGTAISCNFRTASLDQGFPRQDKRYGDFTVDADRDSTTITITPYLNAETSNLAALTLTTGSGRTRYVLDPFGSSPQLARSLAFDFAWSSSTEQPVIYQLSPSYIVQPDTTVTRYTDWSAEGRLVDKYVKGLILECDTAGATKTIDIEADGAVQTSITATASGRQVLQYSFAQFRGRLLRLHPTDTNEWKQYRLEWIFDEEPLSLARWETQVVDHGIPTHHTLLTGFISIQSTANVTLTITGTLQPGTTFSDAYTIPSTGGAKQKLFVPFNARKGVLWKYVFTSASAFWLYREESNVVVVPWGAAPMTVSPFGNDDTMGREMRSSALTAQASGGGQ